MDKKKWPWKRRSSERILAETENSGSLSSLSEKFSDEPITDVLKEIPNDQSPEVTSKPSEKEGEINDTIKALAEKLSAALVNVSAKDDLVKQHSKVAEEAVAGWEKAENEALMLKKQLAISVKQKLSLEDRMAHLDDALKECVRQLRVSREEQEEKIEEAVAKRTKELETHLEQAKMKFEGSSKVKETMGIECLEEENASLRYELEVRTIERDLSGQSAEAASKQYLESIKKVAKMEAECRKLKFLMGKDHKTPSVSSLYVDSFTDSQSDSGDRMNTVEIDSVTFPSALAGDIDLLEDFIEMEKLAALPESEPEVRGKGFDQRGINELMSKNSELEEQIIELVSVNENAKCLLKEAEAEVISLRERVAFLNESKEQMAVKMRSLDKELERERKTSVELAVKIKSLDKELEKERKMSVELAVKMKSLDKELEKERKSLVESAVKIQSLDNELEKEREISVELAAKMRSLEKDMERERGGLVDLAAKVRSLDKELEKEREISAELAIKYEEMKEECEINRTVREQITPVINKEELDIAAGKYAECQKTILSLGSHLKSLATLDDFLLDIGSTPTLSENETVWSELTKNQSENYGICDVNRKGFAKFFPRSKNGLHLEI